MAEIFGDVGYLHLMIGSPGRPVEAISGKCRAVCMRPNLSHDEEHDVLVDEEMTATLYRMPCELVIPEMFAAVSPDMVSMALAVLQGNKQAALELADCVLEAYHKEPK